jgi:hypothetical protein
MHATSDRRLPAVVASVFLAIAIIGYMAGHSHSAAAAKEKLLTASIAGLQLDYPSSWQPAAAAPQIPGLAMAHASVLAPHGDPSQAGLITGQLPAGEPSPLPAPFVANMRQLPQTTVVSLLEVRAYRYSGLSIRGFDRSLTVFAVPNPGGGDSTTLACYASAALAAEMQTCQQIVATLTLVGQSQSYDLTPEPTYARQLSASIAVLEGRRVALRREMSARATPATLQRLATRLAVAFGVAATSLGALGPSAATAQAQIVLSSSISHARDAYNALAAAAGAASLPGMAAARQQVYQAETSVNNALESFSLLGYAQA